MLKCIGRMGVLLALLSDLGTYKTTGTAQISGSITLSQGVARHSTGV